MSEGGSPIKKYKKETYNSSESEVRDQIRSKFRERFSSKSSGESSIVDEEGRKSIKINSNNKRRNARINGK